ncbi:hypothetical protein SBOR_3742 [Sclerotinia borealis F-4128]|uniref:NAD(P)-binding domain-containing protein n=1 Tax=Sclerotinia borealis (strain F-4128) TaxID=1432307 RepID=W9CMQ4_SCLBF|nr:hypothetical protein SBOR_3742 [Sclerotinia borealis F-4128]
MQIFVIGGSGRTGKMVIEEALLRGHDVIALVREPSSIEAREGLKLVKGTPLNKADITAAFEASTKTPSVVLVTLSAPRRSDSPFSPSISPPRLMADSNANIISVMKDFDVGKIVVMQAFGVGDSWPHMHFLLRMLMKKSNLYMQYDDHNLVDKEVKASGMNYVLARPARLEEGEVKTVKVFGNRGKGIPMMASITRESVANWLVDAAERKTWDSQTPVLTN